MKKIIYLITLISSLYTFAQEYPLNTSSFDVPPYGYIKDTQNEYDKYVGLWKGEWNGKTLYIELKKVKRLYNEVDPFYRDEIMGERKIIDANGNVEIDRISNFDFQDLEFWGFGLLGTYNGNLYKSTLMFYPKDMCNKGAKIIITKLEDLLTLNSPNVTKQMTLHFEYMPSFYDANCQHNAYVDQHGDFPMNFPKDIVLTKQ